MKQEAIVLQNQSLSVEVRPEQGGRVSSLRSKLPDLEFLLQTASDREPLRPSLEARFQDGPCAGIEECLPTVGVSGPDTDGGSAPDHGDFWRLPWTVDESDQSQTRLHAEGISRSLRFTKRLELEGKALRMAYETENTGRKAQSFLYACHPLFAVEAGDIVVLPEEVRTLALDYSRGNRLGVAGTSLDWPSSLSEPHLDLVKPGTVGTADMFYTKRLAQGQCAIRRIAHRQELRLSFDAGKLPYLGVWLCYGGWPGGAGAQQYAVALEPTTAPCNTLAGAQRQGTAILLQPGAVYGWEIVFEVCDL